MGLVFGEGDSGESGRAGVGEVGARGEGGGVVAGKVVAGAAERGGVV